MDSIIYERIALLCQERGITIKYLSQELDFAESLIRKWKNTSSPSIDKVKAIANYFGVSTDYLIGTTDIREPISTLMDDQDFVSLQRVRSKMDQKEKDRMMVILRAAFDKAFDEEENSDKV